MTTVVPRMIYCPYEHGDVPVWVISSRGKRKIYYERVHRPGYRPIGTLDRFKSGKTTYNVYDLEVPQPGKFITIYSEKRGYIAPMSWYEVDPTYTGPVRYYNEDNDFDFVDQANDDLEEEEY